MVSLDLKLQHPGYIHLSLRQKHKEDDNWAKWYHALRIANSFLNKRYTQPDNLKILHSVVLFPSLSLKPRTFTAKPCSSQKPISPLRCIPPTYHNTLHSADLTLNSFSFLISVLSLSSIAKLGELIEALLCSNVISCSSCFFSFMLFTDRLPYNRSSDPQLVIWGCKAY